MFNFFKFLINLIFLLLLSGLANAAMEVSCRALIESRPGMMAKVQSGCQQLYDEIMNDQPPLTCAQPKSFRMGEMVSHVFFIPSKQQSCLCTANCHLGSEFSCSLQSAQFALGQ